MLKIKLNCDKENMLTLNTCCFQKTNLTCVLIYSLIKRTLEDGFKRQLYSENLVKLAEIAKSMAEFTIKEVTVFKVVIFLNEALRQIQRLRNLRNIQHN